MTSHSIPPSTQFSYKSASASRNSASVDFGCDKRRPVSRVDIKSNIPDPDDLWALVGKYPNVEDLQAILTKAVNEREIPPERAKFRRESGAVKKDELVARVLSYKKTREYALEFLQEYRNPKTGDRILDGIETLEDFYIQFCSDGPRYRGDVEDSKEIQEAAMIEYIEPVKKVEKKKKNAKIPKKLYEVFHNAIKEDDGDDYDTSRLAYIYSIIKIFQNLSTKELKSIYENIHSNYKA